MAMRGAEEFSDSSALKSCPPPIGIGTLPMTPSPGSSHIFCGVQKYIIRFAMTHMATSTTVSSLIICNVFCKDSGKIMVR